MSGKLWKQRRIIRYYLNRWPSERSMKRARLRIKALTDRSQCGQELEVVIFRLNQFLRGWGNCFRTRERGGRVHLVGRLRCMAADALLIKKRGRNLRGVQVNRWTRTWFHDQGLHQLIGTIKYPKAA